MFVSKNEIKNLIKDVIVDDVKYPSTVLKMAKHITIFLRM